MFVEKATRKKIKSFRTDNGGEYISSQFEIYFKAEGIKHDAQDTSAKWCSGAFKSNLGGNG